VTAMPNVAFIGLGNMGAPMAANLLAKNHHVLGFDLSEAARKAAAGRGIAVVGSAQDAVRDADVVITMLPAGTHVVGAYTDLLAHAPAGALFIDCSTIDVDSARRSHAMAEASGRRSLDAPVSGGTGGAQAGTLTFMAGGSAAAFEAAFAEFGVPADSVVGGYAMAETVFAATQCLAGERRALSVPPGLAVGAVLDVDRVPGEGDRLVLSSGRVLPGMELGVLVDGGLAGERVYGEIVLRGACLFSHYGGMDEAQSNIGADGNFRTGDLGMVADGHLYVFGRLKEIIIVNGRNLFAGDIEVAVGQVTGIRPGRVAAFGLESAQTGSEVLIIVAERTPGANMPMAELRGAIARLVSEAFLVTARDIRIVEERWLVKSSSGKVARGENVVKYEREFGDRK